MDEEKNELQEDLNRVNDVVEPKEEVPTMQEDVKNYGEGPKEPPKKKKGGFGKFLVIIILLAAVGVGCYFLAKEYILKDDSNKNGNKEALTEDNRTMEIVDNTTSDKEIEKGKVSEFDLSFLKEENKKNMIYSPLSIKYCLKMLEEASDGNTKTQIEKIVGDYELPEYKTSKNLSLANGMFIQTDYKDSVKQDYIDLLKKEYGAEVNFDAFATPANINKWISDKTFGIIENMLDSISAEDRFYLVNALAIDMEWNHKFLESIDWGEDYAHEKFAWTAPMDLSSIEFDNGKEVSSMGVVASVNKYDIVEELGEDEIKKTVKNAFLEYFNSGNAEEYDVDEFLGGDKSKANIEKKADEFAEKLLKEIDENYGKVAKSTDFRYYVDDEYKVFAKELKEYDGTTLEYIGIMPREESLNTFVKDVTATQINSLVSSLKDISLEDSKDGVVTKIYGNIPKFTIEYDLDLMNDLKKLGITDVFDLNKADLSKLSDEDEVCIGKVLHKANIEFTQEGIKAAAVTLAGGLGAGELFDVYFDVPLEEIDITFDKPYMYIIRDKESGEVWFVGTVDDPLEMSKDTTKAY